MGGISRRSATWQYGREYGCTNIAVRLMMQLASGAVRLRHRGKPDMPPVVTDEERSTRAIQLLKPENWPTPKWFMDGKARKIQTYEEYFTFQLRARYSELENDFRSILGNFPDFADIVTAT